MLNYHDSDPRESIALRIASFGELLCILECGMDHDRIFKDIDLFQIRSAFRTIDQYITIVRHVNLVCCAIKAKAPPIPSLESLKEAGLPLVDEETYLARMNSPLIKKRRKKMAAFMYASGWRWDDQYIDAYEEEERKHYENYRSRLCLKNQEETQSPTRRSSAVAAITTPHLPQDLGPPSK
jgi:hypothetical protein